MLKAIEGELRDIARTVELCCSASKGIELFMCDIKLGKPSLGYPSPVVIEEEHARKHTACGKAPK